MASQDYAAPNKSIDAQALINDAPLSKYQWMIAIICFLIILLMVLILLQWVLLHQLLAQDWGVDRSQLGPVMSAALGGMIIGALVSGPTADRLVAKSYWLFDACIWWLHVGICLCNQQIALSFYAFDRYWAWCSDAKCYHIIF